MKKENTAFETLGIQANGKKNMDRLMSSAMLTGNQCYSVTTLENVAMLRIKYDLPTSHLHNIYRFVTL